MTPDQKKYLVSPLCIRNENLECETVWDEKQNFGEGHTRLNFADPENFNLYSAFGGFLLILTLFPDICIFRCNYKLP